MTYSYQKIITAITFFCCFSSTLDYIFNNTIFSVLSLPIAIIFAFVAWYENPANLFKQKIFLLLSLVILFVIFITLEQNNSIDMVLGSAKDIVPFFMFFIGFSLINIDHQLASRIIKYIYLFCLLQIPVSLLQVLSGIPLGDRIGGTFGIGSNQMLLFAMVFFNIISSSYYLTGKFTLKRYAVDLVISLIPITLASTMFSFILFLMHLVIVMFLSRNNFVKLINLSILALSALFVVSIVAVIHDTYRERGRLTSYYDEGGLEKILSYGEGLTKEGSYGRTTSIKLAYLDVCENNLCQGYGLGASNVGSSYESTGSAELRHFNRKIGRTQYSFFLIEFGLLVIFALFIIHIWLYLKANKMSVNYTPFYLVKLTLLTVPILYLYQKPLNYTFSGFFIAFILSLTINLQQDVNNTNEN